MGLLGVVSDLAAKRKLVVVFDEFQDTPVAAASLGQVHRARVDGRDVVVKVLRPGVAAAVALDLDISFRLLFWVNILFPNHHVRALKLGELAAHG